MMSTTKEDKTGAKNKVFTKLTQSQTTIFGKKHNNPPPPFI